MLNKRQSTTAQQHNSTTAQQHNSTTAQQRFFHPKNLVLMVACSLLFMFSCRPPQEDEVVPKDTKVRTNKSLSSVPYSPSPQYGGKQNPYSMKNIREVRELFGYLATTNDPETEELETKDKQMLLEVAQSPLDPSQRKFYVSWQTINEAQITDFANALKNTPNIEVFPYPLDSITYKAQNYQTEQESLRYFEDTKARAGSLYAVLSNSELASFQTQAQAQILDTLYFPKQEEVMLEFFAHLLTDNIDEKTMMTLAMEEPELYQELKKLLDEGGCQKNKEKFIRRFAKRIIRAVVRIVRHVNRIFNVAVSGTLTTFGWGTTPSGTVRVRDDIRNQNVPVVGVRVNVIHWGRIMRGQTNAQGNYSIPNARMLFGSLTFMTFENDNVRVNQADLRTAYVLPDPTNPNVPINVPSPIRVLGALTLPSAIHVIGFRSARDLGNTQYTFESHTQTRHWCTILNALEEYNIVVTQRGIQNLQKLLIWATWTDERKSSSAPMLGYLAEQIEGKATIVQKLMGGNIPIKPISLYMQAFAPDITINEGASPPPVGAPSLTQNVKFIAYHELAHASHYFKTVSKNLEFAPEPYWVEYISNILVGNDMGNLYGTNINTNPGRFCALPEAWSEYMQYQVAMQYYPTQEFSLFDVAAGFNRVATIEGHAEQNQLFSGTRPFRFIPNGLFYDLMDVDGNRFGTELFDRVSGFTTQQIFNLMRSDVRSMQEFKVRFESLYGSNPNFTALFLRYNL
jgi:hypothetical protein